MLRPTSALCGALLFVLLQVPAAFAQTLFIDAALSADIERRATVEIDTLAPVSRSPTPSGTLLGGSLAIGTMVNEAFSVRFEMHWQGELAASAEAMTTPFLKRTEESREKLTTGSVLVGYHTPRRGAVQLTYLGGVTFAVAEQLYTSTSEYNVPLLIQSVAVPLGVILPIPFESTTYQSTSYGVTAEVGLDGDVSVTRRFSIVPQIRAFAAGNMLSVRPGIAARLKW